MARKPTEIGGLSFPTKRKATEYYRTILYRYEFGETIPEPEATHLHWLIERHPESAAKIGPGVAHFSVRPAVYGTRCFEVVRVNGETTEFSFGSCIDAKAPTALAEALSALRSAVAEEVRQMKWEHFRASTLPEGKVRCAISGREISLEETYADHVPPNSFKSIALKFISDRAIDVFADFVTQAKDNQYEPILADDKLAREWRSFYSKNAVIRVIARTSDVSAK